MPINRDCPQCTDIFLTSETRRLFCSDACNVDFWRGHKDNCYYCGVPSEGEDHIYPQTYGNGSGDTIPACTWCNSTLQHVAPTSHLLRMKHLLEQLEREHFKHEGRGTHTDGEISGHGEAMQQLLHSDREKRQVTESRIECLRDRIAETLKAQVDLEEVGTELEDFEVDIEARGYIRKDVP